MTALLDDFLRRYIPEYALLMPECQQQIQQTLSNAIGSMEIRECEECTQPFYVNDQRRRYCGETCASKVRFRRWSEKRAKQKERQS